MAKRDTIRLPFLKDSERDKAIYGKELEVIQGIVLAYLPKEGNVGKQNAENYDDLCLALNQYYLGDIVGGKKFIKQNFLKNILVDNPSNPKWIEQVEAIRFFHKKNIDLKKPRIITEDEIEEFKLELIERKKKLLFSNNTSGYSKPEQPTEKVKEYRTPPLNPDKWSNSFYEFSFTEEELFHYIEAVKKNETYIEANLTELLKLVFKNYIEDKYYYNYNIQDIEVLLKIHRIEVTVTLLAKSNPTFEFRHLLTLENGDNELTISNHTIEKKYIIGIINSIKSNFFKRVKFDSAEIIQNVKRHINNIGIKHRLDASTLILSYYDNKLSVFIYQEKEIVLKRP